MSESPRTPKNKSLSPKVSPPKTSTSRPTTNRSVVRPGDVCVGCILWLPERPDNSADIYCSKTGQVLGPNGYDHPVVVTGVKQKSGSRQEGDLVITIAMITSLKSLPLSDFLNGHRRASRNRNHLPILGINDEDIECTVLYLEGTKSLRKQSYVRLENIYDVPLARLRTYPFTRCRAYDWRLDEGSYRVLMDALSLKPQTYIASNSIWQTASSRLSQYIHLAEHERLGLAGPSTSQPLPSVASATHQSHQCVLQGPQTSSSSLSLVPRPLLQMPPYPDIEDTFTPPRTSPPTRSLARPHVVATHHNNIPHRYPTQPYLSNYGSISAVPSVLPIPTPHCTTRVSCRPFGSIRRTWSQMLGKIGWTANPWSRVLIGASCLLVVCVIWGLLL